MIAIAAILRRRCVVVCGRVVEALAAVAEPQGVAAAVVAFEVLVSVDVDALDGLVLAEREDARAVAARDALVVDPSSWAPPSRAPASATSSSSISEVAHSM